MRSSTILRRRSRCRWNSSASARRSPARSRSNRWTVSLGGSFMTLPIPYDWRADAGSGQARCIFPQCGDQRTVRNHDLRSGCASPAISNQMRAFPAIRQAAFVRHRLNGSPLHLAPRRTTAALKAMVEGAAWTVSSSSFSGGPSKISFGPPPDPTHLTSGPKSPEINETLPILTNLEELPPAKLADDW